MKKSDIFPIIGIALAIVLLISATYFFEPRVVSQSDADTKEISLSVEGLTEERTIETHSDSTVLNVLTELDSSFTELQLETTNYGELGILVESMGGWNNGTDQKYWQYEVNGIMPQIGASSYVLNDGDKVTWHFSESTY